MKIDWIKINKDYECPLNPAALFEYKHIELTDFAQFDAFAESYLRCADILLLDFINYPTDVWMPGIIFRSCMMAIELKIKALVGGTGHNLNNLITDIQNQYNFAGNEQPYIDFILNSCGYAHGSETGRYPTDKNGNVLCKQNNGVLYIKIGQMVYFVHDLFNNYFAKLTKKGG